MTDSDITGSLILDNIRQKALQRKERWEAKLGQQTMTYNDLSLISGSFGKLSGSTAEVKDPYLQKLKDLGYREGCCGKIIKKL